MTEHHDIAARKSAALATAQSLGMLLELHPTADVHMLFSGDRGMRFHKGSLRMTERYLREIASLIPAAA